MEAPEVCAKCPLGSNVQKYCKEIGQYRAGPISTYIPDPGCPFVRIDQLRAENEGLKERARGDDEAHHGLGKLYDESCAELSLVRRSLRSYCIRSVPGEIACFYCTECDGEWSGSTEQHHVNCRAALSPIEKGV